MNGRELEVKLNRSFGYGDLGNYIPQTIITHHILQQLICSIAPFFGAMVDLCRTGL